ncbi:PD-(D/E)XK nuclease domain-containing protein [Nocardia rhamnosiphila]
MATRNLATRLQALIEEASSLDSLANEIQGDDEVAGIAATKVLRKKYIDWYNEGLSVVPEDLRDRFRDSYQGGQFITKIKAFLDNPREPNPIYKDLEGPAREIYSCWRHPASTKFFPFFREQLTYLGEALARISSNASSATALEFLEEISRKFPLTLDILGAGHRERDGLGVKDEYDVQHILHAVLVLHYEEVEPEEPTPSMASGSSRLDFLLKQERVAIETKMIRPGLTKKKLRSDLANDILYFRAHPNVDSLFILIYDPQRKISNARGFENDLNSDSDDFKVRVVIAS